MGFDLFNYGVGVKITMLKFHGGQLSPANEEAATALERFKNSEQYEIEIKLTRNPQFHAKVFKFFQFCFEHWKSDREFMNEAGQFDVFRKNLTVLAGYYDTYYTIKGDARIEAKSLAFSSMAQDEFEGCYQALIAAAMRTIFNGCGHDVENKLIGFF